MSSTWTALTWHYARQALPMLAMMVLVMIAGPLAVKGLFVLNHLTVEMEFLSETPRFYFSYVPMAFLFFLTVAFTGQHEIRNAAYPMPVSTGGLVGWHLVLAMLVVAIQNVFVLSAYRILVSVDWPIFEPTVLMMVGAVLAHAVAWSLYDISLARLAGCLLVIAAFFGWGAWLHFPDGWNSEPHFLPAFSVATWLTLATILAASWYVAVHMIRKHRCGATRILSTSDDVLRKVDELLLDWFSPEQPNFSNGHNALAWHEWRRGRLVSIIVGLAMAAIPVVTAFVALNSSRGFKYLEGCVAVTSLLAVATGMVGSQVASVGLWSSSKVGEMSTFLATAPLSDRDIGKIILRNMLRTSWLMWFVVALAGMTVPTVVYLTADAPTRLTWLREVWLYKAHGAAAVPIVLGLSSLVAWTISGSFGGLVMTGRQTLISGVVFTLITGVIVQMILINFVLPESAKEPVITGVGIVCGLAAAALSVWLFVRARQRDFVSSQTIAIGAAIWMCVCALLVSTLPFEPFWQAVACGLATLTVAPFASAPLAVSWDRHR
jgi:hypothetical protein